VLRGKIFKEFARKLGGNKVGSVKQEGTKDRKIAECNENDERSVEVIKDCDRMLEYMDAHHVRV
jgi:hypothetical protein